jgi:short-subunit dehydrogenase
MLWKRIVIWRVGLILEKSLSDSKPVALVTGASSGIGAVYAEALAEAGYHLILVARREEKLKALQARTGGDVLVADLATDAGINAVVDRIRDTPALDFLVNNAGFGTQGYFWEAPIAGQDAMHRLHVMALPRMVARDRGFIVNVASVAGFGQNPGSISYFATKTWMTSFTEGLWLELGVRKSNVRVQALCPGFTRSEFHDAADLDMSRVPESLWHSAENVVEESLNGLPGNELFVIPGWRYQVWVAMQRVLPRPLLYAIAKRSTKEFRKPKHA